ncbi:MAG: hypothetical protein EBV03_12235, partial [Proteobacteria bacterium]|nr:hypothetical protein [Pseudomonadota bacterium]
PWIVDEWGDHEIDIYDANDELICALQQEYDETGRGANHEIEANAALISAAPELLQACQLLCALEDNDVHAADTRWKQARKDMRAAIEKATRSL